MFAHVLPVSDDGGSTAEIVRELGNFLSLYPNKFVKINVMIVNKF